MTQLIYMQCNWNSSVVKAICTAWHADSQGLIPHFRNDCFWFGLA